MDGRLLLASIAGALVPDAAPASAALVVQGSVGGAPAAVVRDNLDVIDWSSGEGVTASGVRVRTSGSAASVEGHSGLYARPFVSGRSGAGFGAHGGDQDVGPSLGRYMTAGSDWAVPDSWVELVFPVRLLYLGLLWGSVDWYNQLDLFDGGMLIGSVTGRDVMAAPNGDQGIEGTVYVNISSDQAFDRVVAKSGGWAFEFDNVAFSTRAIPAPGSALLLGLGAAAISARRRQRACKAARPR